MPSSCSALPSANDAFPCTSACWRPRVLSLTSLPARPLIQRCVYTSLDEELAGYVHAAVHLTARKLMCATTTQSPRLAQAIRQLRAHRHEPPPCKSRATKASSHLELMRACHVSAGPSGTDGHCSGECCPSATSQCVYDYEHTSVKTTCCALGSLDLRAQCNVLLQGLPPHCLIPYDIGPSPA